jgi:hypothetical protein
MCDGIVVSLLVRKWCQGLGHELRTSALVLGQFWAKLSKDRLFLSHLICEGVRPSL